MSIAQEIYPRFYCDRCNPSDAVIEFPEQEAHHAHRVLRLGNGSHAEIVDGKGSLFTGVLVTTGKKHCHLKVEHYTHFPRLDRAELTLAVGLLKSNDRMQWLLEKCTELGVARIVPLITANAERRHFNTEKALLTLVAGLKQSRQYWMPELTSAVSCKELPELLGGDNQLLLAHCRSARLPAVQQVLQKDQNCAVLIGPEGDFTAEEVDFFTKSNAREISLGKQRLRTETAALKAVIEIQTLQSLI